MLKAPVAAGKIIAQGVLAQPKAVIILYRGIMFITGGNIIVDNKKIKRTFFPLKRSLEKAKADREVTIKTRIVESPAMTREFKNHLKTGVLAVFCSNLGAPGMGSN